MASSQVNVKRLFSTMKFLLYGQRASMKEDLLMQSSFQEYTEIYKRLLLIFS
uniref:Uncharacterized protein n=1 Tax=Lepeophtheirus salmonis TaxID=72036 RepID=A0A0K2V3G8_LEPSM